MTVASNNGVNHEHTHATTYTKTTMPSNPKPLSILIASDFYYPRLGGVELHQYSLAQSLMARGHHVVVLSGTYMSDRANVVGVNDNAVKASTHYRQGIRYMTGGLKVYYLPIMSLHQQASLPTLCNFPSLFDSIVQRERIDIVHCHQATSAIGLEALVHGASMGLTTVYTDHSLFGMNSVGAIHLNKLMGFSLALADRCIAVSYCTKQNLAIRTNTPCSKIHVIPNAVDSKQFEPVEPAVHPVDHVNDFVIVVLSRLVYRKGVELLADVIPPICARYPHARWVIGGDGNKQVLVEEMCDRYGLHGRVNMLGAVKHRDVPHVLSRGHIFLNTSLTESFCMAICEAVSCGLYVVSTCVGGIPEVLPPKYIRFADCDSRALIQELSAAIDEYKPVDRWQQHCDVAEMYNWHTVAAATERVYVEALQERQQHPAAFMDRILTVYNAGGSFSSLLWVGVITALHMYHLLLNWMYPLADTDCAVRFLSKSTAVKVNAIATARD